MINPIRKASFTAAAVLVAAIGGVALAPGASHAALLSRDIDQQAAAQQSVGQQAVGQEATSRQAVGQEATSQQATSQQAGNQPSGPFARPNFQGSVYGDFTIAGNSVLRCPTSGEALPGEPAACAAASQREQLGDTYYDNQDFYLERNTLSGQSLFDAGQAQLTIPAGATVRYAQIDWGGSTGQVSLLGLSHLLTSCGDGLWALLPAQPPPSPAAAGPQQQNVQLGFASSTGVQLGQQATVQPAHFGVTDQSAYGVTTGMYSAYADVTSQVQSAVTAAAGLSGQAAGLSGQAAELSGQAAGPSGQAAGLSEQAAGPVTLTATVGNVWAMSGHSCAAGWSLVVVFGYDGKPANPESPYQGLREVNIYSGQYLQQPGATTSVTLPGLNDDVNAAGVELGVTAYDGDINGSGQFLVGGQAQSDPCSAGTSGSANFFSACAQGALDPLDPTTTIANNFSVDAKAITPGVASGASPPGSSVQIGMTGTSQPYLLQSIVLSESIQPAIKVSIAGPARALHVGQTAPVAITVRNPGDVPLYHVRLTAAPASTAPTCPDTSLGTLAPGASQQLTCTVTGTNPSFPVAVIASGRYRPDDPQVTVTGSATAAIQVVTPAVGVALSADPQVLRSGHRTTVTFTVTNNSVPAEGALNVRVGTDPALPGCHPAPVRRLRPGHQATVTCTTSPAKSTTVVATATATDSYQATASATSTPLAIAVLAPALAIAVQPQPANVQAGQPVNFTVVIHNTGNVPLAANVTSDVAPACDFSTSSQGLPVGAAQSRKCTVKAPSLPGAFTDTARFTADPVGDASSLPFTTAQAAGLSISGQATGTAEVLGPGVHPALDTTVQAQPAKVKAGQPVNFTVVIHNTGNVPLAVTVTNDVAPACNFSTSSQGLPAGAAQSKKCTVKAPSTLSAFTDTAQYTAKPVGHTTSGVPITGTVSAASAISGETAGTAKVLGGHPASSPSPSGPPSSVSPVSPGVSATSVSVGSAGAGASSGGISGAATGVAIGIPVLLGAATLVGVGSALSSRSRRNERQF